MVSSIRRCDRLCFWLVIEPSSTTCKLYYLGRYQSKNCITRYFACDYCTVTTSTCNSLYTVSSNLINYPAWTFIFLCSCWCPVSHMSSWLTARHKMRWGYHVYARTQTKLPFPSISPTPHLADIWYLGKKKKKKETAFSTLHMSQCSAWQQWHSYKITGITW